MSADEVVRAMSYAVMIAAFGYIGVRVWNATVMPEMLRRPVAVLLWLQGAIYALIMIGLLLLRLAHPVPALLWVNTGADSGAGAGVRVRDREDVPRHATLLLAAFGDYDSLTDDGDDEDEGEG